MEKIVFGLIKFRWMFFLVSLVVVGLSINGLQHFFFDSSPRIYFNDNNKSYERFLEMEDTYGRIYRIFIMVSAKEDDIFRPDHLEALQKLTDESWTLPFVRRVDSLSNFQYTSSEYDELIVDDIFAPEVIEDATKLAKRKTAAVSDPDIAGRLVSLDGKHAAVILSLSMTSDETQTVEGRKPVELAYALEETIKAEYPSLDVAITGNLVSVYHSMVIVEEDVKTMIPAMFLLMFVLLGILLKSLSAIFIAFLIATFSAVGALGLASWLGVPFSMLAINALIISITVAVAHCIHIFTQFFRELRVKPKRQALLDSLKINFYAVTLTSLTTAIGFLSLNTNDLPPAVALGNAAAIGAGLAWLFSLTLLPALVLLLPFKPHKTNNPIIEHKMESLANIVIKHRYVTLLGMCFIAGLMTYFSFSNKLNDNLIKAIHEPHVFRSDTDAVDRHFGALYINTYEFDSGTEYGISDPEYLRQMDKFAEYLRQQPEVSSVYSIADVIKRLNQTLHNDDPAFYQIPDNRELISQYMLMYEMSLPFGLDLGERITHDKRKSILSVYMPSQDTDINIAIDQRIANWQQENLLPKYQDKNISISTIWSYLTIHSLMNSIEGSVVALTLISFILLFMLRSIRYGLISLIPNIMPAVFGFGAWYFYSGNVGLGLTCVTIITIGIVVDDTVHFLAKYQTAMKKYSGDTEQAIRATFRQVGPALLITTLVLASGFSVLALSGIIVNSALGQVTCAILISAFLLDILLLPALLLIFDQRKKSIPVQKPVAVEEATKIRNSLAA